MWSWIDDLPAWLLHQDTDDMSRSFYTCRNWSRQEGTVQGIPPLFRSLVEHPFVFHSRSYTSFLHWLSWVECFFLTGPCRASRTSRTHLIALTDIRLNHHKLLISKLEVAAEQIFLVSGSVNKTGGISTFSLEVSWWVVLPHLLKSSYRKETSKLKYFKSFIKLFLKMRPIKVYKWK